MDIARFDSGGFDPAVLYDQHPDYLAKRDTETLHYRQWRDEVFHWKIPNLMARVPSTLSLRTVCEVGCATGELIANIPLPVPPSGRIGFDISPANVAVAQERFPEVGFLSVDISEYDGEPFDLVILSDIVEHVVDDVGFLKKCSSLGRRILLNLPLEKCLINRNRKYGTDDESGHIRPYDVDDAAALIRDAGFRHSSSDVRWYVDQPQFREHLRQRYFPEGASPSLRRRLKYFAAQTSLVSRTFRHWYFPSNLFALLEPIDVASSKR